MNIPSILGLTGTLIDLVRAAPQLARLIRARKSFGVSVDTSGTSCIVSLGWTVYGVVTNQPYVTLASGIMAGIFFIITLVALQLGRSVREFRIAPIWLAVLLVSGASFGKNGLGLMLSVSALVSNIPQIWVAYREVDLSGLSLGTWLLTLSGGLVWGLYGILQHDVTIVASAFFQSITSGIIIILKTTRQFKSDLMAEEMS
ncbi:MAG: PQ-loop repeat-containing protein [Chloroflexi bacterium]|nr:PQ-loop repeat-containing protein [Chloroflexota bacterium]